LAKIDMSFVPYSGSSLTVYALLGEHVTSFLGNYTDVSEQLKGQAAPARRSLRDAY
jgi:tripartite-type tricarboxylate transporter receptor subunit TctC